MSKVIVRDIDCRSRLVVDDHISGKAFWIVEEDNEGNWKEVLRVCESIVEAESLIDYYLENRRRSLYE